MKLPETFRIEKDLEEKTKQLVKEATLLPSDEQENYIREIEDRVSNIILALDKLQDAIAPFNFNVMDLARLRLHTEELLEDFGYHQENSYRTENGTKNIDYWTKTYKDKSLVFIETLEESDDGQLGELHYKFAILKEKNLQEFMKINNTYEEERGISSQRKKINKICEKYYLGTKDTLLKMLEQYTNEIT